MYYDQVEVLPREELHALQDERLRQMVHTVYERVPFYRDLFDRAGIQPADVRSIEDLPRLPFTKKQDLKNAYPLGMLAVPREQLVRVHASSGTTGKQTMVGYTRGDINLFAEVVARSLMAAGARPGMVLHNAYGYGLFTGGLELHYGAERLGMTVVPVSGGMTQRQVTLILDLQPDVLCCTPSYAQTLGEEFKKLGVAPGDLNLQYAILGAEPWSETIRADVDTSLGLRSVNFYGLSEIIGPGVSAECVENRSGSHIWEDHFYPEVVDVDTGQPVADGVKGVLVLTHLTREAMPLLRYWTGDITYLTHEPCPCGRTAVRMGPVLGRADDMLIVRGVNLYPTQVEEVLMGIPEVVPHYQIVVTRERTLDEVEVKVEVGEHVWRELAQEGDAPSQDELKRVPTEVGIEGNEQTRSLRHNIQQQIRGVIGLNMKITLMAPGSLPRSEGGKLKRSIDLRKL